MYPLEALAHRQRAVARLAISGRCLLLGAILRLTQGWTALGHGISVNGHGCFLRNLICRCICPLVASGVDRSFIRFSCSDYVIACPAALGHRADRRWNATPTGLGDRARP
jgi:hypothetical protein